MSWTDRAACRGMDTALFFPSRGDRGDTYADAALAVCRRCPVVRPCLRYALAVDVGGVWGATTAAQRAALRLDHDLTAIAAGSPAAGDLTLGGTCT